MLLAAAIVGLLTYYYFGQRPGVVAAAVALALFVLALVVPGLKLIAYAVVGVGLVGVCVVGPKRRPVGAPSPVALLMKAKRAAERMFRR